MRINRKHIDPDNIRHKQGWYDKNDEFHEGSPYVRVDFANYSLPIVGLFVLLFLVVMVMELNHIDNHNVAKYQHICDMMAGKEPHYVSESDDKAYCVIGKDFIRKEI